MRSFFATNKAVKGGLWLNRQQVKWLVVLLALLPLIPTGLLVRLMVQNAAGDREEAAAELASAYREQLKQIADRYSVSTDVPSQVELENLTERVFGEEIEITITLPDMFPEEEDVTPARLSSLSYEIDRGACAGWVVTLRDIPEFADHLDEQRQETVLHAVGILSGVSLVAGCVWFAVNRRLKIDELRTDLVTTVSHEMKTPVAASKVLLETLAEGNPDHETRREYLELLGRENDRMAELAEQFLTFARLDSGQLRVSRIPCELGPVIEEQIALLRPQFQSRGGEIQFTGQKVLPVKTDPAAIKVILSNLIGNALKYGGTPPCTRIGSGIAEGQVWISVSDNGPGIPLECRETIFREYDRGDRKLSSASSGIGLGLAISQRFARLLGGRIRVATREDGTVTSSFILSLPAT